MMKRSLYATACAVAIIASSTYAQYDTSYLQGLIDNSGTVNPQTGRREVIIQPKVGGPYITQPLRLPGNLELILEAGVVIETDPSLFIQLFGQDSSCSLNSPGPWGDHGNPDASGENGKFNKLLLARGTDANPVSNLTIIGRGTPDVDQAILRMRFSSQPPMPDYPTCSNFVHALALRNVSNVEVSGLTIQQTGGDGIEISDGNNVHVHDCIVDDANRNGISIISGIDITVEDCTLKNSSGKSPQSGMDIEPGNAAELRPDDPLDVLQRIRIRRCTAEGNSLRGFFVNVVRLRSTSPDIDILFEDCEVHGSNLFGAGFEIQDIQEGSQDTFTPGNITLVNCSVFDQPSTTNPLANHLRVHWALQSPLKLELRGLHLHDERDSDYSGYPNNPDWGKLVRFRFYGPDAAHSEQPKPIVINGTVTGTSGDPLIWIETLNCDPPCGPAYEEVSGCLAADWDTFPPNITVGPTGPLPNFSIPDETPVCGNGGDAEACEECDCGGGLLLCDLPSGEICDNCIIAPTTPTIYARWDQGGITDQPLEGQEYTIETTGTGSPQFPNVILNAGHDDWRIWSVNRNHITDIGVLSSPATGDFKVKLMRPDGAPAARHVKGITLVPEAPCTGQGTPFSCCTGIGTGSCGNTNIAAGQIAGDLGSDGLVLKNSDGQAGAASFIIDGDVSGDINIPTVDLLQINGAVDEGSTITINGITQYAEVFLFGPLNGSINLNNQELRGLLMLFGGSAPGSQIVAGPLTGALRLLDGTYSGSATFSNIGSAGYITVTGNVGAGASIYVENELIEGIVRVDGLMSGDICAPNLNPAPVQLPDNLDLASIDSQGSICGTHICGSTAPLFNDTSSGVRSISFRISDPAQGAIAVNLTSLPCGEFEGQTVYAGPPQVYKEWLLPLPGGARFIASRAQEASHYDNWSQFISCEERVLGRFKVCDTTNDCMPGGGTCSVPVDNLVHVFGSAICPSSISNVQLMPGKNAACAEALTISTNRWGDVETPYNPPSPTTQPDIADVSALVNTFRRAPGALIKARALLVGNDNFGEFNAQTLDQDFDFRHIGACLDAFRGVPYPHKAGRCKDSCNNLRGPDACAMDSDCMTGHCVLFCPD